MTFLHTVALLLVTAGAVANARLLSTVFGDGMVLQGYPGSAALYGKTAVPGTKVTVSLDSGSQSATVTSDKTTGKWEVRLAPVEPSTVTRHTVAVTAPGEAGVTISDVLFGDVYFCSGQSNMAFQLYRVANAAVEIEKAAQYTNLRLALIPVTKSVVPLDEPVSPVQWTKSDKTTAAAFSAVCLLFGERVHDMRGGKVPIGLVASSMGGTIAESWTPKAYIDMCPCDMQEASGFNQTVLYNAMVNPFVRMRISAQLWYQGESNEANHVCYGACTFPALINGWRKEWEVNEYIRKPGQPMTVIGHRGASSAGPENTLVSQLIALKSGTQWVEDDTHPSLDKVPFVLHDDTVDRTTDGKGKIRDLTAAQLKKLDAGSWFSPVYKGTTLPTLQEQLADLRARGGKLLMEIKGLHSFDDCKDLVNLVRAEKMTQHVLVQSFEPTYLQYIYSLAPDLPIGLLRGDMDADPVAVATKYHLTAYNPTGGSALKNPGLVAALHKAGVAVWVWCPDTADDWMKLEKIGVDGIITNRPAELQGWNAAWLQGLPKHLQNPEPPASGLGMAADGAMTPFLFVQLAPWYPSNYAADIRLAQAQALSLPYVGMASAVDLGMPSGDIHPTNKQDVASRLALLAQKLVYGANVVYQGPAPAAVTVQSHPPDARVKVTFDPATLGSGLLIKSAPACPTNSTVYCGNTFDIQVDGKAWLAATFSQADASSIVVSAKATASSKVTGVRHLHGAWPLVSIYNKEQLPATPFAWKL